MNPYRTPVSMIRVTLIKTSNYLKRVTAICLSIDHIKDLLLHSFTCSIPCSPIVASTHSILSDEEILGIVDVLVGTGLYAIDDLVTLSVLLRILKRRGLE